MALVLKDRVKETSSSSGTGSITLGGAFPGYQTFNAAIATGSTVYYTIHNLTAGVDNQWEVGVGTFTSPATLARTTVLSSSNSGSLVPFTAGASGLEVFITQPAEEAVYLNQATGLVEVGGNGTNTVAFTNINASNVVMTSGTISTNAANATDITNKTYVDGLFSTGVSYHEAVVVETPSALTAVYVQPNGAGNGVGATLTNSGANVALVIDGITLSNTARVLVYNQANAVQNGVYTVTNPGNVSAQWVLTRSTDTNTYGLANPNSLGQGDAFFVTSGNTGAGRTYICNTSGTITFGTTNITFAQLSSAQIYAAGTGLNLSNLTFSVANTAVTAATYGNAGAVSQITVNAQGQITNAANVSINASSITLGTLDNARTTAASANGASTIVLRDSNGSFNANVVTATTVNATTGNFTNITGNGASLTDINASNITSGTISNARTTGSTSNSASTIVLRDASGNFGSNVISAASFSGDGTAITAINASNISSGTVANARTTASSSNGAATIVLRDSSGSFSAGVITANGSGLSAINASNVSSGTLSVARGGTGLTTLTANNVILGNGTSTPTFVAPGASGNILTSDGSTWASSAPSGSSYTRTSFTATGGQTTFSVTYTVGFVQVYLNGVFLNGTDFTATNGTSVVLATGATAGDIVETVAFTTSSIVYSTATNLAGGSASQIPYQSGSGTTAFIANGTAGQVLTSNGSSVSTWTSAGDATTNIGYRNIPLSGIRTTAYTLVAGDVGKFVELGTSGSVVIPASIFTTGDAISIFNNTSGSISCDCSAITDFYKGGTDTDISTFSVTTRGVATILFITATRAVVTGNLA